MEFVIDIDYLSKIFSGSPIEIALNVFRNGGWIVFLIALLYGLWNCWLFYAQTRYYEKAKFMLIKVNIQTTNEQSPKAVENIFAQLSGAHTTNTLWETYGQGDYQLPFAFEIVSLGGYINFFIYTETRFKNLVETIIYAQYPDAEIFEVNDYVNNVPAKYPDPEYDLFGFEFILANNQAYPIKTHIEFEHALTQELKDPLSGVLEALSCLTEGEQGWYQIIVTPTSDAWKEASHKLLNKLMGAETKAHKFSVADMVANTALSGIGLLGDIIPGGEVEAIGAKTGADTGKINLLLNPLLKKQLDGIARKASKIGFKTKIRYIYIGKREVFSKARGVNTFVGGIKQFNTVDLNALKPDLKRTGTRAYYVFTELRKKWRKNKLISAYKSRSGWRGSPSFILNIEELATLYHFPSILIKAPLIKKVTSRKAEPPTSLPTVN